MDDGKRDGEISNEANGSSWWSSWPSWLQTAKEKSSTALEFMKRDLTEFSHVVQTGSVAAVSTTAAKLKEKLTVDNAEAVADRARQSFTSVLETITDVFAPQKELEDSELMIIKDSEPVVMNWWQTQLYLIRKDPKTFCHEPEGPPEMYENWLESFNPNDYQDEMTEIMMTSSEIRTIYDKLVPTSVSHLEFWQRYFYRVHLLRKAEAKRADLMRRAEQISIEDIEWDKDTELDTDDLPLSSINQNERQTVSTANSNSIPQDASVTSSNQNQSTSNLELRLDSTNSTETIEKDVKFASSAKDQLQDEGSDRSPEKLAGGKTDNIPSENRSNETSGIPSDPSSADSSDGSRLSPIESLGKDSSTGDEWEKDFDLEINENDLKNLIFSAELDSRKEVFDFKNEKSIND